MKRTSLIIEKEIIAKYETGHNSRVLAKEFDIDKKTVINILRRYGKEVRANKARRTYSLNEHAFDNPENAETAYWIGFLMADGCITSRNGIPYVLKVCLQKGDHEHLEKLKLFLGSDQPVAYYRYGKGGYIEGESVEISISSKTLCTSLAKYNVCPRKSMIATVPESMKNNRDFWRGMIDGDGWITRSARKYPAIGLCGTRDCCEAFRSYVKSLVSTNTNIRSHYSIYKYAIGSKPALATIRNLYLDSIVSLARKQEKANYWLGSSLFPS